MAPSQLHGPRRTVTQWLALYCLLFATLVVAAGTPAPPPRHGSDTIREAGRCSLGQTTCGQKGGVFGEPLPCVSNELAIPLADDPSLAASLLQVCGPEVAASWTSVCCNQGSLDRLSQSLQQAQAFIALCPACSRSFTSYYCHFTCSPDQSTFVTVSDVQDLGDAKGPAVKSLELHVDQDFGESFYDACANVKFAATNGLAMDFIGGGAKDWKAFLRYMGQERPGLGSPFQINIPQPANQYNGSVDPLLSPVKPALLSCASPDPSVACACADCPERCLSLPPLPDQHGSTCHVGALSCGSFFLVLGYTILLLSFMAGIGIRDLWERRHTFFRNKNNGEGRIHLPASPGEYDRMDLTDPTETRDSLFGGGGHESAEIGQRWKLTMRRLFGGQGMRGSNRSRADSSSPSTSSHRRPQSAASSANIGGADSDSNANSLHRPRLGRGASLISPDILAAYSQPRTYRLNTLLSTGFYKLGLACASAPWLTIALGLAVCGALNAGWSRFAVERDPVKLWVSHDSELAVQKRYFEQEFGPFYRTEQIFLHKGHDEEPVLDWNTIVWWADVEDQIRKLRSPAGTSLEKVCFAPTADSPEAATASDCTVQSFLGYFKDNLDGITEENWEEELDACATNPTSCLSSAGQPLNPRLLFGGVPGYSGEHTRSAPADGIRASEARALVVTYVINNSLDKAVVRRAAEWERALKQFLADLQKTALNERGLKVSFSTEVSLEEELNKATNTDVPIVVLSYVVMFLYVSISLGGTGAGFVALIWAILLRAYHLISGSRSQSAGPISLGHTQDRTTSTSSSSTGVHHLPDNSVSAAVQNLFVDSKFMLGLLGIAIVLLSVSTSVGLFSFFGVRVTLIIAEVIPFLVLAIGVDNVFILAHELERQNARAYGPAPLSATDEFDVPPAEERVGRALGRMGPSILLSSSCQTVAFGLGAFVGMPAVRNFAIYAAGAVAINALLQVTVFVAAMTVDLKRIESHRVDCLPCIKLVAERDRPAGHTESIVVRFIRSVYAPFLLKRQVKYAVVATFAGLFVASWICTDYIQLGLDQRLALPRRSYLVDYFDALDAYLDVGPPVYFVSESADVEHRPVQQALCGRFSTCDDFSLANVLEAERKRPKLSYLAEPPAVWLDDFFQWLNPILESCCSVKKRNPSEFCGPDDNEVLCKPCYEDREPGWNITMEGLPEGDEFIRYLHQWLESPANQDCALGGKAGYSSAVAFDRETGAVQASHFRTYHTPLKHQSDFIDALASAKRISEDLSARTGTKVFPYSIFYVYFEQYARIVTTTRAVLALALLAVFTVTSLLLGSWRTGSVVVLTVFLIVMNVMGVMGIWHISLNAISLVNLVIAIGIGVEFCSHIARAFMGAGAGGGGLPHSHPAGQKERDDRAYAALIDVGSSVFSGITLTKIIGISVLALTKSKLLEIYYFRMWLTLILSGALHGLVFLPVALSFQGGQGYSLDDKEDLDFIEEVARYRGRPFFAGDEDDDDQSVSSGDRF